jgi:hypothetical protein
MENGRKIGTISISLSMILKKRKTINKLKGKNIRDQTKMHPPSGKPKGKKSYGIFSVKSNKPRMITIGSLIKEKFGPSINVIIIVVGRIATKNFGNRRVITPIFFRENIINVSMVKN